MKYSGKKRNAQTRVKQMMHGKYSTREILEYLEHFPYHIQILHGKYSTREKFYTENILHGKCFDKCALRMERISPMVNTLEF